MSIQRLKTSLAKRVMSDKLLDLLAEIEVLKYRRGIVKGNIAKYKKAGDTKNESIHKNRYEELVKLEKEIQADIFAEVRLVFGEY